MTTWALLAPGPSATAEQARKVQEAGIPVGAIGNAFQLVDSPAFIAATDSGWWRKYPEAKLRGCQTYAMHAVADCEQVRMPSFGTVNSGVLGLEVATRLGATRILLLGFDMRGTHFFGPYTNGLRNTAQHQRKQHLQQYERWGRANKAVEVVNCTPGSAMACFPVARLEEILETCVPEPAADEAGQGGDVCQRAAA